VTIQLSVIRPFNCKNINLYWGSDHETVYVDLLNGHNKRQENYIMRSCVIFSVCLIFLVWLHQEGWWVVQDIGIHGGMSSWLCVELR